MGETHGAGDRIERMNLARLNFGISNWRQQVQCAPALSIQFLIAQVVLLVAANSSLAASPVTVKPKVAPSVKKVSVSANNQVASGRKLFEKLTCAGCHPSGGNTLHPYRPLKGPGFLARYKEDRQIDHLIRTGVARAGMPAFNKSQLSDKDMKDLIVFIRSLTPTKK